jgi:hypothetical protein
MNKPFSSFNKKGTLKDRWISALHDPGYWLMWIILIILLSILAKG